MLYSSLGKPRGHFQPLSSNIAGAVSILAHMHDTAITHGKSKSVSKHSMCQLVFIFRHFPKDIFGLTSHILRWLDLIIFLRLQVFVEKTCSQTIWLICFYFYTPWNTWVQYIPYKQTHLLPLCSQPVGFHKKINWFGWIKVWNVSIPIHWVTLPQKESLFSSTPKNFQCTKGISKKCFFTAAASKRP